MPHFGAGASRRSRNRIPGNLPGFPGDGGGMDEPEDSTITDLGGFEQIAEQFFLPELQRLRERQPELESDILSMLEEGPDFSRAREEMQALAEGVAGDLFRPGGAVEEASSRALRGSVESGFGPASGGYQRAQQNILGRARERITGQVAQQAPALAQTSIQSYLGRLGEGTDFAARQAGLANDLAQSLVGIRGQDIQEEFQREQLAQNEALIREALSGGDVGDLLGGAASGALSGAAIGSAVPGLGPLAGGIIGGAGSLLGGLF